MSSKMVKDANQLLKLNPKMNRRAEIDRLIGRCDSWQDFVTELQELDTTTEKGRVFERLTQLYLQTISRYCTLSDLIRSLTCSLDLRVIHSSQYRSLESSRAFLCMRARARARPVRRDRQGVPGHGHRAVRAHRRLLLPRRLSDLRTGGDDPRSPRDRASSDFETREMG